MRKPSRLKQHGLTLLEALIAIVVTGLIAVIMVQLFTSWSRKLYAQTIAEEMIKNLEALEAYTTKNFGALQAVAPAVTGFAVPLSPTITELRAANYGVSGSNASVLGINIMFRLVKVPASCVSPDCNFQQIVYLDGAVLKDGKPDYSLLGQIVEYNGALLGYSSIFSGDIFVHGASNTWSIKNPKGGASYGILAAMKQTDTSALAAFVRRDGTAGMLADLDMTNHALANTSQVNYQAVTLGAACTPAGATSVYTTADGAGMAICNGGAWQPGSRGATIGATCSIDGATAIAWPSGAGLICEGGTWINQAGRLPKVVDVAQSIVGDGSVVAKQSCTSPSVAQAEVWPIDPGADYSRTPPRTRVTAAAADSGATWKVSLKLIDQAGGWNPQTDAAGNAYNLRALMRLTCVYP